MCVFFLPFFDLQVNQIFASLKQKQTHAIKVTRQNHTWSTFMAKVVKPNHPAVFRLRQVAETAAFGNPFQTGRTSSKKDCLVGRFLLRFTLILCLSRCSFGLRFGIKICNVCMHVWLFFHGIYSPWNPLYGNFSAHCSVGHSKPIPNSKAPSGWHANASWRSFQIATTSLRVRVAKLGENSSQEYPSSERATNPYESPPTAKREIFLLKGRLGRDICYRVPRSVYSNYLIIYWLWPPPFTIISH